MRGLSEYRIRAADSISPPLASGSLSGSVSTRILPSALGPPLGAPLDSGCWILESVGGLGRCGPPGFCILDSGNWAVRWTEGCGPPRFCILYSGKWAVGGRVDGRPDSGFCILETGVSRGAGPARILYSAFCILHSVFCRRHVHVMHMHGSRDGT